MYPDICQGKMSILLEGLKYARTSLNDLLVLLRGSFKQHIEGIETVLIMLINDKLEVNGKIYYR